ncbi:sensor histidine kinase [Alkalicoccobacillus gibsonii]|uniref:sensor histidine kinase n=1 Tax=Alkalicoccobacillus gibsonii TaxID=79881 RepID=UPI003F7BA53F
MNHWSIKRKVWITIAAVIFIVVAATTSLIYFLYNELYVDKQIDTLTMQGEKLTTVYAEQGVSDVFLERVDWANQSMEADVLFTDDPMLLASGDPLDPNSEYNLITFEERQLLLNGDTVIIQRSHPRFNQEIVGVVIPLFEEANLAGAVFLYQPLSTIHEPFQEVKWLLLFVILALVVLILFLGSKMIRDVVNPLISMNDVATKMEQGDFKQTITLSNRHDEMGQLAESVNRLAHSLNEVEQNRNEFLANVSHELRTPLSYMKGYAEGVEEGIITKEKGLGIIQKEANRLDRLVNDLLDLAQLEGDQYKIRSEPIALAELVDEVIDQFNLVADKKDIKLLRHLNDECIVYGDADRLEQVIRNLLDNALTYTPGGKQVEVRLEQKGEDVTLLIRDEGIGIPTKEIDAVKQRFYRVKKARERKDGGTGLGLSIVSQIIAKHGGTFSLESTENVGTTASIHLKGIR